MDIGIRGLEDLAAAEPAWLAAQMERFGDQHGVVARTLVAQARVQRDDRVERLLRSPAVPELETAPGILLYDIESDPDARHDFLHGFVCLPRDSRGAWLPHAAKYHPVLMLQDHPETRSWRRLRCLLDRFASWPILHYGETESLALRRMAQRQGVSDSDLTDLRHRLVDVHARVRSHWRLPLNSYGLKSVAAWRGFRWSQTGADGARALLWWRQWQGEGQRRRGNSHALDWIFRYNRDDCLATWAVAEWLLMRDGDPDQEKAAEPGGS